MNDPVRQNPRLRLDHPELEFCASVTLAGVTRLRILPSLSAPNIDPGSLLQFEMHPGAYRILGGVNVGPWSGVKKPRRSTVLCRHVVGQGVTAQTSNLFGPFLVVGLLVMLAVQRNVAGILF